MKLSSLTMFAMTLFAGSGIAACAKGGNQCGVDLGTKRCGCKYDQVVSDSRLGTESLGDSDHLIARV